MGQHHLDDVWYVAFFFFFVGWDCGAASAARMD